MSIFSLPKRIPRHYQLDLARIHARYQTVDSAEMIRQAIDVWEHAQCEAKERDAALEELRRLSSLSLP